MQSGIPESSEYHEYYQGYVSLVDSPDILTFLRDSDKLDMHFYERLPMAIWDYRYAPDKWTVKGVVQHVIDTERIFAYRLLRICRGDQTPLAGFDQNAYADNLDLSHRDPFQLKVELNAVRQTTISLLDGLREEDWTKIGSASDSPVSVRALAHLIAGHEIHHRNGILEKYLGLKA